MKREESAVEKRNRGYNCAQAVICAFADVLETDEKQLFAVSECFGSGLGCTKGTCGALNGACMVIGMLNSTKNLERPDSKAGTYMAERSIVNTFEQQAGALVCRDIKGIETGKVLCECEECVRIAARLVEQHLENMK
ncbi:MAG: C-GCAxxG-C-C family protein [Bulleidia sp.]